MLANPELAQYGLSDTQRPINWSNWGVLFLNHGTFVGTFQYHQATISILTATYSLNLSPVVGLTPTI